MVPGHEIAGHIVEVGSNVTKFKVGDRAGIGTFVDSCNECEPCKAGQENYCLKGNVQTYNGREYDGTSTMGGYSREIVAKADYVLHIPEGIDLAESAPLLCAGITVYSPLAHWGAGPGKKVAILGMGGLGHIAVKMAAAMGAEVYVLGHSTSKRDEALSYGATDYRSINDPKTFEDLGGKLDFIVNATSANIDVNQLLSLLKVDGSLVFVGLPPEKQSFGAFSIVPQRRSISGSNTGGIQETQEMLDFCAKHGIGSTIELVDASNEADVDTAWDRVVASDVRYRFVIDASTI
jgi:uncharacterized zinc-type alcohol dehydrogenase-like protein